MRSVGPNKGNEIYCGKGRKAGRCQSKVDEERKRNFPCTLVKPPLQCKISQNQSEISLALTSSNALLIHLNVSLSLSLIDRSVAGETLKCYSTNDSVAFCFQWTSLLVMTNKFLGYFKNIYGSSNSYFSCEKT